ncbi:MAG: aquaporin [bacterium]|nr:aquaporin [bacterium]
MAKKKSTKAKTSVKKATEEKVTTPEVKKAKVVASNKSVSSDLFDKVIKEVAQPQYIVRLVAELIGTFLLASVVIATQGQPIGVFFGITAVVLMVGALSGAHINPAITLGAWATKKIKTIPAVGYIVAQVLGAMLSFVLISAFINAAPSVSEQAAQFGQQAPKLFTASPIPEGKEMLVMWAEFIGMSIFAFGVSAVAKKKADSAVAFGVGGSLFVALLIAGSTSAILGASSIFNPAIAVALQAFTIEGTNTAWAIATYVGAALLGGVFGFGLETVLSRYNKK